MKKKLLLVCLMLTMLMCLFAISVSAAVTEVHNGITYSLSGTTANVTNANKTCTLEIVIIPETVTGADGKPYTVTRVNQDAFNGNKTIKYLSLPATITWIGPAAFRDCSNLQYVDFNDNQNNIDFNNYGHFWGTGLKAFSFPDNVQVITNRILYNCPSLEAVYLPSKAVKIGTNSNQNGGAFDMCTKMYFVEEAFDVSCVLVDGQIDSSKFTMPAKPSVYKMPSTLTTVIGHVRKEFGGTGGSVVGSIFYKCQNINDVLVFGENFHYIGSLNLFSTMGTATSPKTVVFLGDIQGSVVMQQSQYISYVFANPADKSMADIGIVSLYKNSNNTDSYMYFCATGKKYNYHTATVESSDADTIAAYIATMEAINEAKHVRNSELDNVVSANCTDNKAAVTYCFCGAECGRVEEEGTALGHEFNAANGATDLGIAYANGLFKAGTHCIDCARCDEIQTNDLKPIFYWVGFSAKTFGEYGFGQQYIINVDEMAAYKAYLQTQGKTFSYGVVAAGASSQGNPLSVVNGAVAAKAGAEFITFDNVSYDAFFMNITGMTESDLNASLVCCAYVQLGDEVVYLDNNETVSSVTLRSYNDIDAIVNPKEEL